MNSSLVPEPRFDANGRLVIRHVRPDAATSKLAPTVPPPSVGPVVRQTQGTVNSILLGLGLRPSQTPADQMSRVAALTHKECDLLHSALASNVDDNKKYYVRKAVIAAIDADGDFGRNVQAYVLLAIHARIGVNRYAGFLTALGSYPELAPVVRDLGNASPEDQKRVTNIAEACASLHHAVTRDANGTWRKLIDDEGYFRESRVLDVLVRYSDRANEVAAFYLERNSIEAIDEAMATTPSLREGAL